MAVIYDSSEDTAQSESEALNYRGRKTSRAGSEQRRRCILEAAMRIVVREGVRGVRHRAVAKEADVPLSATTYYFRDISDLITDTFILFVETGIETYQLLWGQAQDELDEVIADLRQKTSGLTPEDLNRMVDIALQYVRIQLMEHRDYLLAEQAFRLECLNNDNLRPIARKLTDFMLADTSGFMAKAGSKDPHSDARSLIELMDSAEYEGLLLPEGVFDEPLIRSVLSRGIQNLMLGITNPPLPAR